MGKLRLSAFGSRSFQALFPAYSIKFCRVALRDDASIAPYKFHFITRLFVSPKKQKNAAMYFPSTSLHSYFL